MTTTVRIDLEEHSDLKMYCKEHDLSMIEVLNGIIKFITLNDIHPNRYLNIEDEDAKDLFSMQNKIIAAIREEGKKTRDTYISFQRTFEKTYDENIKTYNINTYLIKEAILLNTKNTVFGVMKRSQSAVEMKRVTTFLLTMTVEKLINRFGVDREIALEIIEEKAKDLHETNNTFFHDIEEAAELLINRLGTRRPTKE